MGDEGQAMLEGLLAVIVLLVVLSACFFLFVWGNNLQHAHMGARVLAFRAATPQVAWPRNPPKATTGEANANPAGEHNVQGWGDNWSNASYLLGIVLGSLNSERSGTITDQVTGKVFIQDAGRTTLGFRVHYLTASDPWKMDKKKADLAFFCTAWGIGHTGLSLQDLSGNQGEPDNGNILVKLVRKAVGL